MAPLFFSYVLLSMKPYQRNIFNHWDSFIFFFYGLIVLLMEMSYSILYNPFLYLYIAILVLYVLLLTLKTLFPGCYVRCLEKAENCELLRKLLKSDKIDSCEQDEDFPDRINNPQDYLSQ